jgi:ATP-dependent Clp protease protease subunit
MHAWIEAEGDPEAKQSYKFPHHKVGTDTAANINGVNNALARLSQSNIPSADDAGVRSHLNAHREDAGLEVTEEASIPRKHEPIRCFEGNAKPHEAFWRLRNADESVDGEPEMELYGYISEYSWWDDDITPKMFKDDLYNLGKKGPITLRINSGGGDIYAASVMRSILMDYPGNVTVKIDGLAASAATVVAIAGDVIKMQETAYFMIHDPLVAFFFAVLTLEDLSRLLDEMKVTKNGIVDAYQTKSGLNRDKLARMMADETWMTAREAKDYGFVDEVITQKAKKNDQTMQNAAIINALHNFMNVPAPLKAMLQPENLPVNSVPHMDPKQDPLREPNQTPTGVQNKAAERLRAEIKIYKEKKI